MAKVIGPLHSLGATGKFGDAMVFLTWKGRNVVRQWLIPANPMSEDQGDVRAILASAGKLGKYIGTTSPLHDALLDFTPSGQTWISFFLKEIMKNTMVDGTTVAALLVAYAAHGAKADFDSEAATLGITQTFITYAGLVDAITPGAHLYILAVCGINLRASYGGAFDVSPFDTAIGSWTATEIGELITAITSV